MTKSKKIFLAFGAIFMMILAVFSYDISRRTTVPWKKNGNAQNSESAGLTDADSIKTPEKKTIDSN